MYKIIGKDEIEKYYVTRGVLMLCSCATHSRRFDIEKEHGYRLITEGDSYPHPLMESKDSEIEKNVRVFGICKGSNPPSSETVILVKDTKLNEEATGNDKEKVY